MAFPVFQAEFDIRVSESVFPSVAVEEINERKETLTENNFTATLTYKCLWADRLALAKELKGLTTVAADSVTVVLPHRFPEDEYKNSMVNNVGIAPFGKSIAGVNPFCRFQHSLLTASYSIPDGETSPAKQSGGDPSLVLTTESLEPTVEFITLPNKKLFFDNGQLIRVGKDLSPVQQVHMMDWVVVQYKQPSLPSAVFGLIGKSNQDKMTAKTITVGGKLQEFEPETLLFNGPFLERETTTEGIQAWRVTYRLSHRPVGGWNKFPKDGSTLSDIFDELGAQVKPYPPADFSPVIPAIFG